jgi:hypothetical protein
MSFILSRNRRTPEGTASAMRTYERYIASQKERFPPSALSLATSDWYFGCGGKSPHDSWLERLEVLEVGQGDRKHIRSAAITIRLLSSFQDGQIELSYPRVFGYSFATGAKVIADEGHGDWLWDEFTVSGEGHLVHEIEWQHGIWKIVADDVRYAWIPYDGGRA